jgi:L-ribulose-5-phosphate 3-epimerase
MQSRLGIMQGRLSSPINNRIQAFPETNWQDEFRLCQALGLQCIEWIYEYNGHESNPLMSSAGIDEMMKLKKMYGIDIASVVADYFMVQRLFGDNQVMIKNAVDTLYTLIDQCAKSSIPIIELPFVDASALASPEDIKQLRGTLLETINYAGGKNVLITMETDLPPKQFYELIESFCSPYVKVNYDMGNSASLGYDPAEEIMLLGKYIANVHIKDRLLDGGTVPLGCGNADFKSVFAALKRIGYHGDFILQAARRDLSHDIDRVHYEDTIRGYIDFVKPYIEAFS